MSPKPVQHMDVCPGDVVRCVAVFFNGYNELTSSQFTPNKLYNVVCRNRKVGVVGDQGQFFHKTWSHFEFVDEPAEPTLLKDMSDDEAGKILKAFLKGESLEVYNPCGFRMWMDHVSGTFNENVSYRVKAKPVVKQITLFGGGVPNMVWCPDRRGADLDTHIITYTEIDGEPDCDSVKMEKL